MGGDITVQSEFGKGTTFSIYIGSKARISKIDLKNFEVTKKIPSVRKQAKLEFTRNF